MLMELTDGMLLLVSIILTSVAIILCKIADDGDSITVKLIVMMVLIATAFCLVIILYILMIRNGLIGW